MGGDQKGGFTIKTAALFFLISAVFEVLSLESAVLLFGEIRGGLIAVIYHLIYTTIFLAIGFSLWVAKPWAFYAVFCGSIFYSLDKLQLLLDRAMLESYLFGQMGGVSGVFEIIDRQTVNLVLILTICLLLAGWWGFVIYLYIRRDYFRFPQK